MKRIFLKLVILSVLVATFSGCSVVMASKKEGTSIEKVQSCRTRGQFLSSGATIISSEKQSNGELIEVYQYQKERGSAVRALMHGALDVATLGVWEVVGTPIEACVDEKSYFIIKVFYSQDESLKKVELI